MASGRGTLNEASIMALRSFVAVVETQSFSSAARQLRLVPSSVTKHVQQLEGATEVALVHRTTRRISVTEAGERFYQKCLSILAEIDSAAAEIAEERKLAGHLRVTAPPSFVASVLGPNLHRFLDQHPGLALDVIVTSGTPDLIRDRIDVAILLSTAPETKLAHVLLAESPRLLCAAPSYLAQHGVPQVPDDLSRHRCLASRFSELAEPWLFRKEGPEGERWENVEVRSHLLSDNGEFLRQACLSGAGIGNFYAYHVSADIAAGRLVRVLPGFEAQPKNSYAVIPHRHLVRPQIKVFVDFVRGLTRPMAADPALE